MQYACISLSLQKWDFYVLKVFPSLKCFIDIEIRCGIFLFLHLFHWHLNQVIQINRTDRNSDSIQLWMFAICYWSLQCLRWRLWHGNFIPNNCWQNCTTNPNQTQPNPIDIIYIRLFIYVCILVYSQFRNGSGVSIKKSHCNWIGRLVQQNVCQIVVAWDSCCWQMTIMSSRTYPKMTWDDRNNVSCQNIHFLYVLILLYIDNFLFLLIQKKMNKINWRFFFMR